MESLLEGLWSDVAVPLLWFFGIAFFLVFLFNQFEKQKQREEQERIERKQRQMDAIREEAEKRKKKEAMQRELALKLNLPSTVKSASIWDLRNSGRSEEIPSQNKVHY